MREPIEVSFVAALKHQHNELGGVVRVFGEDKLLQGAQARAGCFKNEKDLSAGFDFSLPPVMGFDFWDYIGASDKAGG